MQNFLIQLWNDLRARRLLPVAVLLLAGLVAAPIVLSKKAGRAARARAAPAPARPRPSAKGPEALAQVKLEDALGKGNGSSLSAFDVNNPFAPPEKVLKAAATRPRATTGVSTPDTGGTGDTTVPAPTPAAATPAAATPAAATPVAAPAGSPKTSEFTYVLDVTFWANGQQAQDQGPREARHAAEPGRPLLIFMGVSDGAGNAVFLVDSTLETAGEGKCKPSRADCAFLYLGAGSEQEFTNDDGDSYRLRINEIRKVKVGDESGAAASEKQDQQVRARGRRGTRSGAPLRLPGADRRRGRVRRRQRELNRRRRAPIEGVWQCAASSPSACSRCRPWRFSPPRRSRPPPRRRSSRRSRASRRCASASATC